MTHFEMFSFKIFLWIAICLACIVSIDARKRIVGGTAAAAGEYPFYFWAGGSRLCGGSLIWGDFVLTAAHCGHHVFYRNVKYGSTNVFKANTMDIAKLIPHPQYNDTWMSNDVMLIQLKNFIPQTAVKYVTLNSDPKIPADGAPITAMGYGADGLGNYYTESLMKVDLNVVGYFTCVKTYGTKYLNHSHMICNGGPANGGKDSCYGDSGGPIMLNGTDVQVGLVSWGRECGAKNTPAVNARVSEYVPWIQQNLCMYSVQPPPYCPPRSPVASPISPLFKQPTAPVRKPIIAPVARKPTLAIAPVRKPTKAPVRKPTLRPIRKPTVAPTKKPTVAPVHKPTLAPTNTPTTAPTNIPTNVPMSVITHTTQTPSITSTEISGGSLESILETEGADSSAEPEGEAGQGLLEELEGSQIGSSLSTGPNESLVSVMSNL